MKKIILLIVLLFFLGASTCKDPPNVDTVYVYEKTYNSHQRNLSLFEAYAQLRKYGVDSTSMDRWLTNELATVDGYIYQNVIISYRDSARYDFIYTTFISKDSTYYQFRIRKKFYSKQK